VHPVLQVPHRGWGWGFPGLGDRVFDRRSTASTGVGKGEGVVYRIFRVARTIYTPGGGVLEDIAGVMSYGGWLFYSLLVVHNFLYSCYGDRGLICVGA